MLDSGTLEIAIHTSTKLEFFCLLLLCNLGLFVVIQGVSTEWWLPEKKG